MLSSVVFGAFGAIFSASLKFPSLTTNTSIPEVIIAWPVTMLRMAMGAGAALLMFYMLDTPLAKELLEKWLEKPDPSTYYLIAFVAGFSERLVLRVMNKINAE